MNAPNQEPGPLSLRELISSVMAALLGVQSSRNHARDFARGTAGQYIAVGLFATVIFVVVVYAVVQLILRLAVS